MFDFLNVFKFVSLTVLVMILAHELAELIFGGGAQQHRTKKTFLASILCFIFIQFSMPRFLPPHKPKAKAQPKVVQAVCTILKAEAGNTTTVLENEVMRVYFTPQGGRIAKVRLLSHAGNASQGNRADSLVLLDEESSAMGLAIPLKGKNGAITTLYTAQCLFEVTNMEKDKVVCTYKDTAHDLTVQYTYRLGADYTLGYTVTLNGTPITAYHLANKQAELVWEKYVDLKEKGEKEKVAQAHQKALHAKAQSTMLRPTFAWRNALKPLEEHVEASRKEARISYRTNGKFRKLNLPGKTPVEKVLEKPCDWVCSKQKFFNAVVVPEGGFTKGKLCTTSPKADDNAGVDTVENTTWMAMEFDWAQKGRAANKMFKFYFGPNDYTQLKATGIPGLAHNVYLGPTYILSRYINQYINIPLFRYLQKYIQSFGWLILLLVCLFKLCMAPLAYYGERTQAKMKRLKPELDKLNTLYPEGSAAVELARATLYRNSGINPLVPFLLLLLQLPVLLTMRHFFQTIAFRKATFLWFTDLSTYDATFSLPFRLPGIGHHISFLALIAILLQLWQAWRQAQNGLMQGYMVYVSYLFVLPWFFFLNSAPTALAYYRLIAFLIDRLQKVVFEKLIDQEQLYAEMVQQQEKAPAEAQAPKSRAQLRWEKRNK